MRNEMTMYQLKPIVSLPQTLRGRKTMYEMRNIHEERSTGNHTEVEDKIAPDITEQNPLPEYNALETRQEKILTQLAELKQQVLTLSNFLNQTKPVVSCDKVPKKQDPVNVNLIINVNPKRPPYSVRALQRVWRDSQINVQTYIHSSVSEEGPVCYQTAKDASRNNVINVSLIWKDVKDLEIQSGLRGYHVTGETNFLRYLTRLISSHDYENSNCIDDLNTIDLMLDLCYSLYYEESSKQKYEIVSTIADKLDLNWSNGRSPNIVDIAVWCTVKQVFSEQCPPKLKKWFQTCETLFT
ncbi:uncharacterized protein LOC108625364 isoform X2 [Ceratina calcarata]|uniref:Uncharacterized protein LOC108625364 isoform X2 n=1 Tax=Ceratina calcarata TaxID=156304 RepID=A0AAJ7N707_9HYME|nr:uncharacterized protein LOC108625364 isoform X2 [Ceratina calcarata]